MVVWSKNCVLNVKLKMFPHFRKMLPNMFPNRPDDVLQRPRRQACWGTLLCHRVQYAGTCVPHYTFCHFSSCLVCSFLHLCNSRGALCTWVGLPSPRHSVSCIMPCLPPDYDPKEHALEVVAAAKLKVRKPLLVQKRQSRGGVHFGTISKVPLFIALLVLGLHFFLHAFLFPLLLFAVNNERDHPHRRRQLQCLAS